MTTDDTITATTASGAKERIGKYRVHPAAAMFPLLEGQDYENLRSSIEANGQQRSIVVLGDVLLDGRNRLRVCLELGVEPRTMEYTGKLDPVDFILVSNVDRRHLTEDQRVAIRTKIRMWVISQQNAEAQKTGKSADGTAGGRGRKKNPDTKTYPGLSVPLLPGLSVPPLPELSEPKTAAKNRRTTVGQIAEAAKVSHHKAEQAVAVAKAAPDLLDQVAAGLVELKDAAKQVKARAPQAMVEELKVLEPERKMRRTFRFEEWTAMSPEERLAALSLRDPKAQFNLQDNENIGWARFSTNQARGCELECPYCYARDFANRFYPEGFEPVFVPELLSAAANTPVPKEAEHDISYRNVFVCSMGDLFGNWVPKECIEAVLQMARENPQWNFLFLTKVPQRLAEFEFPDNAWVGTSVDHQGRVRNVEQAMAKVKAGKRWISVEPQLTRIEMDFSIFDWVVIGGASKSTKTPEWRPPHIWVYETTIKAKAAGCSVYHKSNLFLAEPLREFPGVLTVERQLPEEFGLGSGLVQLKVKS
jgi:protein gp37